MDFSEVDISQADDPWQELPLEMACHIISNITDVHDISKLIQTSSGFRRYAYCIQHLTSNTNIRIPVSYFEIMPGLQTIDHKIEIPVQYYDLDLLSKLDILSEAYFVLQDINLLSPLLQVLNGLNLVQHYFKISLVLPATTMGILIQNGRYIIIPAKNSSAQRLVELLDELKPLSKFINNIHPSLVELISQGYPSLVQIIPPESFLQTNLLYTYTLLKKPMRDFLKTADFGLVDPTQPPSDNNPPLSNYIQIISDGTGEKVLMELLNIYIYYHQLTQGYWINADQVMRKHFQSQLDTVTDPNGREINMSVMSFPNLLKIIISNRLESITVDEISKYEFPVIISTQVQNNISDIVTNTFQTFRQLRQQSRVQPNVAYYATDGSLRYLS